MTTAQKTAKIVKSLPPAKADAVLDYARYLADRAEEDRWEQSVKRAGKSRRFRKLLADVDLKIERGETRPLNFENQ